MENTSVTQNRRSRRSQVYLTATLEGVGSTLPVKLRNLSSEGALVEGKELPIEGSQVVFHRNELNAHGRVVWTAGNHAGITFEKALKPEEVLRHIPQPRPAMLPEFRRPGLACREITPRERKLIEAWYRTAAVDRPGE